MLPMYNLFVVEDQLVIRTAYQKIIDREPDLVICGEASSGEEALALLEHLKPDIILLDLSLPGISGTMLIRIFRQLYPNLPILVISGQGEDLYQELILKVGASGYIDKLNVVSSLVETIRHIIFNHVCLSKAHTASEA